MLLSLMASEVSQACSAACWQPVSGKSAAISHVHRQQRAYACRQLLEAALCGEDRLDVCRASMPPPPIWNTFDAGVVSKQNAPPRAPDSSLLLHKRTACITGMLVGPSLMFQASALRTHTRCLLLSGNQSVVKPGISTAVHPLQCEHVWRYAGQIAAADF